MPGFQEVCAIEVDLQSMRSGLKKKTEPMKSCFSKPKSHWVLKYSIAFQFGATELKAFVVWQDRVTHSLTSCTFLADALVYRE